MKKMFKQFSFPCGVPSHCAPETHGSINEGGELGYSIAHAFGAVFDNPDLIATTVVGDGEAETGPLATSWQSNKFLNPITVSIVSAIFLCIVIGSSPSTKYGFQPQPLKKHSSSS